MKQGTVKAQASDAHLIAIYGTWSWDYWDEVSHPNPKMRQRDDGPSSFVAICAGSWAERPSEKEVDLVLARVDASVDGMGHAVRIAFLILGSDELAVRAGGARGGWSGHAVNPGDEFEIVSEAQDAEGLRFLMN